MKGFEPERAAAHNASLSAYERLSCQVFERTFIWNIMGHIQIVESLEFPDAEYYGTLQAHFIQHKMKNIIKFSEGNNSQLNLYDLQKSFEKNIKYKK